MTNGWTGGQYSVFRVLFGTYLAWHFARLLPWGTELFSGSGMLPDAAASPLWPLFPNLLFVSDAPAVVATLIGAGVLLALAFAAGFRDRWAAVGLWYVWACLFTRNPLIANPSIPFVGWLLLAHACLPQAPYGSFDARGRTDPRGDWAMPGAIFAAAWIVMAVGYSYSGWTKLVSPSWADGTAIARVLENPLARPLLLREVLLALPDGAIRLWTWGALALELAFAPVALISRVRPWLWLALLGMHVSLMTLIDFADLSMGMVMLHLFTFDPAWIAPLRDAAPARLFYDGACGLCHRAVRFVLAEDRCGDAVRFSPLQGEAFAAAVPEHVRRELPDSLVLLLADGTLLVRSRAALACAERLGGLWRVLATVGRAVPPALLDRGYDFVARIRTRLFAQPKEACPLLPPELRQRFF